MPYRLEVTDTFGGEANYAWVRRQTVRDTGSRLILVRQLKALMGITGQPAEVQDYGDNITILPKGRYAPCIVGFATWED
jgi:hypothetical protein